MAGGVYTGAARTRDERATEGHARRGEAAIRAGDLVRLSRCKENVDAAGGGIGDDTVALWSETLLTHVRVSIGTVGLALDVDNSSSSGVGGRPPIVDVLWPNGLSVAFMHRLERAL